MLDKDQLREKIDKIFNQRKSELQTTRKDALKKIEKLGNEDCVMICFALMREASMYNQVQLVAATLAASKGDIDNTMNALLRMGADQSENLSGLCSTFLLQFFNGDEAKVQEVYELVMSVINIERKALAETMQTTLATVNDLVKKKG